MPFNHQHAFPFVHPTIPAQTAVAHVDGYGPVQVQHTAPVAGVTSAVHATTTAPAAATATTTTTTTTTAAAAKPAYDGKTITIDGHKYQLKLAD
jgi:hypothetical protein